LAAVSADVAETCCYTLIVRLSLDCTFGREIPLV